MKTSQIARGIVGALSLAGVIGMVGCAGYDGAEGAAGEGEIGSTSEALVADTLSNIPTARRGAASCIIRDSNNVDRVVVAGGLDFSPAVTDKIDVFTPSTGAWVTLSSIDAADKLSVARTSAKGLQLPGISNECIIVGGELANGTKQTTTDRIKLDLGTGLFSVTTQNLNTARSSFQMFPCASDKVIALSGGSNSLEVYDPAAASGAGLWTRHDAASTTVDVSAGVTGAPFSAALTNHAGAVVGTNASTTFLNFMVAGGFNGSNVVGSVDLIKMPTACDTANGQIKVTKNAVTLATVRQTAVAFPEDPANNDDVIVVGGDSSLALNTPLSSTEILNVDFTTTFPSATKSAGTALPALTRAPALARLGTGAFYVIGGENNSGTSSSRQTLASVYHYSPTGAGSWVTETLNDDTSANVQDRSGLVAEYSSSAAKIYSTAGQRIVNGAAPASIVTTQETN